MMTLFLSLIGVFFIAFAVWGLLRPPKKHKDFSLRDQHEAMQRGMGRSPFPDPDDVIPPGMKKK